jgi:hypothetical protein
MRKKLYRLRRGSDGKEKDFYTMPNSDYVDPKEVEKFANGSNEVYITFYDQTGSGNDLKVVNKK